MRHASFCASLVALALALPLVAAGPAFERFGVVGPGVSGAGEADAWLVAAPAGSDVTVTLLWPASSNARLALRALEAPDACLEDALCPADADAPCARYVAAPTSGARTVRLEFRMDSDLAELRVLPLAARAHVPYALDLHVTGAPASVEGPRDALSADGAAIACA